MIEVPATENTSAGTKNPFVQKIRDGVEEMITQARINAKQAFVIDQMVTSLEELNLMVQNTSQDVRKILEIAQVSKNTADEGGQAVEYVAATITNLTESNREISSVTETVQQIARESKLLSINSMVEAARAGTQGVTFMVVAKRIQELAANAAGSASKIDGVTLKANELIQESQKAATSCNESLTSIVARSAEVSTLIERLDSTIKSQAAMIAELSSVVSGVRNDIQVASIKLERGIMTMPELLDAIEGRKAEAAERGDEPAKDPSDVSEF